MNRALIAILCVVCGLGSCTKLSSDTGILDYSLPGTEASVQVNTSGSGIEIEFPDQVTEAGDLVADFMLADGAVAEVNGTLQVSGQTPNNFEVPFSFIVIAEDETTRRTWKVSSTNNDYTRDWGLGGFQKEPFSINREYEFYRDQAVTGPHSGVNCGPTVTVMASMWSDPDFSQTPQDARGAYRSEGGWWYTSDIRSYLGDFGIPNQVIELGSVQSVAVERLKAGLDQGDLAIICLDMYYVDYESNGEFRINKFYKTAGADWGHFLLVKGYRVVDGELYWEIYDPYCWGETYSDGSPKGKNRYYESGEIHSATEVWWRYAILVSEKGKKSTHANTVDPESVADARGK